MDKLFGLDVAVDDVLHGARSRRFSDGGRGRALQLARGPSASERRLTLVQQPESRQVLPRPPRGQILQGDSLCRSSTTAPASHGPRSATGWSWRRSPRGTDTRGAQAWL